MGAVSSKFRCAGAKWQLACVMWYEATRVSGL